jgi:hypothetical protein
MLNGRERTRLEALSQGYGALFRLLSAGSWTLDTGSNLRLAIVYGRPGVAIVLMDHVGEGKTAVMHHSSPSRRTWTSCSKAKAAGAVRVVVHAAPLRMPKTRPIRRMIFREVQIVPAEIGRGVAHDPRSAHW